MSDTASKLNLAVEGFVKSRFFSGGGIQTSVLTLFAAILLIQSFGCASGLRIPRLGLGDALLEKYRDNVWAKRAFNLRYANCDIPYADHFQNGFVAGYCQKCNGGDGYVPPLPPDEYRGYEFQSADGAQCVKAWFDGFPAGVAAAKKDRAGDFHDIYTSKMVNSAISQSSAKHVLPADVPVLRGSVKKAEIKAASELPPAPIYREAKLPAFSSTSARTTSSQYVAPPEIALNPILNPNSIEPHDLVPAPKIKKSGPAAMKRASTRFSIDPAVTATNSITPAPMVSKVESSVALPPIVRKSTNPSVFGETTSTEVPEVARHVGPVFNQAPLPLSVGKPSWGQETPAIVR